MSTQHHRLARLRTRWSAIGAAVAVTLGAGGIGMANAAIDSGDRPVTVTIASERVLDTRTDLGLSGRFADATPRDLQITGIVRPEDISRYNEIPYDRIAGARIGYGGRGQLTTAQQPRWGNQVYERVMPY